jgi:predicted site-specific integrase-resolvase
MKLYLTATEAAKVLQVDRATVSRWAKQGKFQGAVKKDDPPTWQIPLTSVESLMKKRK